MFQVPKILIDSVSIVFNDGNHNAFTDLCRFRDRFYLTFRSCPDGHGIHPTSRIVILASDDARSWTQVFTFAIPNRDVRDPHFLVFKDTLFVYTGTWFCDPLVPKKYDLNEHLGYCAWSADGRAWHGPRFLEGTYGHYIWRAAAYKDKAYLCGRRKREFVRTQDSGDAREMTESALLESDDGFIWKKAGLFQETGGDETAFVFQEDGSIIAVARYKGSGPAQLCRAKPPYQEWTRISLGRAIGGPMLAKWADHYLVGGRKTIDPQNPRTTLYWLINDQLVEALELPSGGDNSYPGFVPLDDKRGLLSYYSSHEGSGTSLAPSAIYLARLRLE